MAGIDNQVKVQLVHAIDRIPEFYGFGIVYLGLNSCEVLRDPNMPDGFQTWIVLEEEELTPLAPVKVEDKSSKVGSELVNMGLSCGSAILAGAATVAATGAAPITGGASLTITVIGWSASVASAAQCGISAGRVINSIFFPENNQFLDTDAWVNRTSNFLEVVSLAGGVVGLGSSAKLVINLSRSRGTSIRQLIKGMTRANRKKLAEDIAKYTGQAATRKQFIKLVRAGKFPSVFTRRQITLSMVEQALASLGTVLDVTGSSRTGLIKVYFAGD